MDRVKQYDYRTFAKTFKISEEAFDCLSRAGTIIGTIEIHREHIEEEDAPTTTVDGETRDRYAVDHVYITNGGDIVRWREYMVDDNLTDDDAFDLLGHTSAPERILNMVYDEEWRNQRHGENQSCWFEWKLGTDYEFPQEFVEELPVRIEPDS